MRQVGGRNFLILDGDPTYEAGMLVAWNEYIAFEAGGNWLVREAAVPEPPSLLLLGSGLLGLSRRRRSH